MNTEQQNRSLSGMDFFLLWAGAGIALPEIWTGGLLTQAGLLVGLAVILAGHVLGGVPMALAALMGAREGIPGMISTRAALGTRGAMIPALLNVTQLVGWTAVMLWIGGQAASTIGNSIDVRLWIIAGGLITTLWALGGQRFWKHAQKIAMLLLFGLTLWMTWVVLTSYDLSALPQGSFQSFGHFIRWTDLVIALPISWMPLAADYARFAINPKKGTWGTWWGYLLASSWMFALGLVAALATGSEQPEGVVMEVMSGAGFGFAALSIVIMSTFTTTFLDIYSTAISAQSIFPRMNQRILVAVTGILGTALALVFNPLDFETFLLFIGAAFCPLFGIVLTDYYLVRKGSLDHDGLYGRNGSYTYFKGFNIVPFIVWIIGFALFHLAAKQEWPTGASIPSMLIPAALYGITNLARRSKHA